MIRELKPRVEKECNHVFKHLESRSYWRMDGRFSRKYYHADYFYCEKCLKEEIKEKQHSCTDGELYKIPDWARMITNRVEGEL